MLGSKQNVRVHSDPGPKFPFRFVFNALGEPNLKNVRFRFELCLKCLKLDRSQSILRPVYGGFQKKFKQPTDGLPNQPPVQNLDSHTPLEV